MRGVIARARRGWLLFDVMRSDDFSLFVYGSSVLVKKFFGMDLIKSREFQHNADKSFSGRVINIRECMNFQCVEHKLGCFFLSASHRPAPLAF